MNPFRLLPIRPGTLATGDPVFFGTRTDADFEREAVGFGRVIRSKFNGEELEVEIIKFHKRPKGDIESGVINVHWHPKYCRWGVGHHMSEFDNLYLVEDVARN